MYTNKNMFHIIPATLSKANETRNEIEDRGDFRMNFHALVSCVYDMEIGIYFRVN